MLCLWIGFIALIVMLLALDLGVFHRQAHAVQLREAFTWSIVWMLLALLFGVFVYFGYQYHWQGADLPNAEPDGLAASTSYFVAYIIEKSLSLDNMFVIALVFSYFKVPAVCQHRVLFWGILGALMLRGAMILAGSMLIARFHWVLYVFGAFLLVTAAKMLLARQEPNPKRKILVRLASRLFPVTANFVGSKFVVRAEGRWMLTPLALALITVESVDVMFAIDSIPAIFAVTLDPFLVFTSNVFAILGLRSLYFALADMMERFRYLKLSLAILLALIGLKMLLKEVLHSLPGLTYGTLAAITLVLTAGIVASLLCTKRPRPTAGQESAIAPAPHEAVEDGRRSDRFSPSNPSDV